MSFRRRPVPREWREENHRLDVRSFIVGRNWNGNAYRATGTCSCGVEFNDGPNAATSDRAEIVDRWRDHVEDAYYEEKVA